MGSWPELFLWVPSPTLFCSLSRMPVTRLLDSRANAPVFCSLQLPIPFCSIFQKISSYILQILLLRFPHLLVEFQFPPVFSFPEYLFKPLSVLTVVTSFLISLRIIICCCSVTKLCLTLLNPMDCSTPGFPVLHYLLEFSQTHVHWVGDAIQPSHPLSPPSPPTFSLSQHRGLFQWVSSSHQVAKVLELQCQHQSFQWIFRTDFL